MRERILAIIEYATNGNNTVTDIYINFDYKKVDAANRKGIDYVLYDKK